MGHDRADIDDPARPLRDHDARRALRDDEARSEIGVDHATPVIERDIQKGSAHDYAGIVDEDINPAETSYGLSEGARDRVRVGNVEHAAAIAGIDIAIWDLSARKKGVRSIAISTAQMPILSRSTRPA
jgi:L-alanine-DL-glutamate epimerase-like enolase superfamily enzyme